MSAPTVPDWFMHRPPGFDQELRLVVPTLEWDTTHAGLHGLLFACQQISVRDAGSWGWKADYRDAPVRIGMFWDGASPIRAAGGGPPDWHLNGAQIYVGECDAAGLMHRTAYRRKGIAPRELDRVAAAIARIVGAGYALDELRAALRSPDA